jgi:hypothetical protein
MLGAPIGTAVAFIAGGAIVSYATTVGQCDVASGSVR